MASDDDRERAAALKHDLGKYVAWRSANLPDAAWQPPIAPATIDALQADILRTRSQPSERGAGEDESAWEIFERLASPWPKPWPAELLAVERAVLVLRQHADALRKGDVPAAAELRAAQLAIRSELAALVRRLAREE